MCVYASEAGCERGKTNLLCIMCNETIKVEKLLKVCVCVFVCVCLTTSLGRLCRSSKGLSRVLVSTLRMTTSSSDRLRTL